jgi:hypothetical protein
MDRAIFFAKARARLFGGALSQPQVEGLDALLDECAARGLADARCVAYVLATACHETGHAMQPVREIGRGKGRAYGAPDARSGLVYYGRGYVQLTWKANYERLGKRLGVDLLGAPDRALEPRLAAAILIAGMVEGLFSGRRLAEFFSPDKTDWIGARRIVNGLDRADIVAGYARAFHDALRAASAAPATPASSVAAPLSSPPPSTKRSETMKGYRTIAFNAAVAAIGFAQSIDWVSVLGSQRAGVALTGIALVNMILRGVTDGPVGAAQPKV